MGLLTFLDTTIDKVFAALKSTSQKFAQLLIVDMSPLRIVAADCGDSTTMYKLVSSAKRRIDAPVSLTISLMNIRNNKGPRMDPWGTPAPMKPQSELWPLITTRCLRPER